MPSLQNQSYVAKIISFNELGTVGQRPPHKGAYDMLMSLLVLWLLLWQILCVSTIVDSIGNCLRSYLCVLLILLCFDIGQRESLPANLTFPPNYGSKPWTNIRHTRQHMCPDNNERLMTYPYAYDSRCPTTRYNVIVL